jgi:hypothetical protein
MAASFPTTVKSFTTKVDGVDDVQAAHINDLQDEVVAVETELLSLLTGWIAAGMTWTRTSNNTFTAPGNVVSLFPVGTKCKCVNNTAKQFYIVSAVYTSLTTVTIAGDTLEGGFEITSPYYSYASNPQGFLHWFNYSATVSGGGGSAGTYAEANTYARFCIIGRTCHVAIRKQISNIGSWSGIVLVVAPVTMVGAPAPVPMMGYIYANSAAVASPKLMMSITPGSGYFRTYKNVLVEGSWADMATNDWLMINGAYEI